ncbi:hypothetical protein [Vibrio gallaecicus]|uniref:hypothetical protein n=1 Tax=Vibrio gallaecicus TaxID=552386 RepID=UPI0025B4632C|nr:hypothetical protein [Vibrio gallaecicus]MDN3616406.1 hypothetical protein [Vibrio gallaecicus]
MSTEHMVIHSSLGRDKQPYFIINRTHIILLLNALHVLPSILLQNIAFEPFLISRVIYSSFCFA